MKNCILNVRIRLQQQKCNVFKAFIIIVLTFVAGVRYDCYASKQMIDDKCTENKCTFADTVQLSASDYRIENENAYGFEVVITNNKKLLAISELQNPLVIICRDGKNSHAKGKVKESSNYPSECEYFFNTTPKGYLYIVKTGRIQFELVAWHRRECTENKIVIDESITLTKNDFRILTESENHLELSISTPDKLNQISSLIDPPIVLCIDGRTFLAKANDMISSNYPLNCDLIYATINNRFIESRSGIINFMKINQQQFLWSENSLLIGKSIKLQEYLLGYLRPENNLLNRDSNKLTAIVDYQIQNEDEFGFEIRIIDSSKVQQIKQHTDVEIFVCRNGNLFSAISDSTVESELLKRYDYFYSISIKETSIKNSKLQTSNDCMLRFSRIR